MKRLERDDLIRKINNLEEIRTFLIMLITTLIILLCIFRGDLVRAEEKYQNLEIEFEALKAEKDNIEIILENIKEENLELYKQLVDQQK